MHPPVLFTKAGSGENYIMGSFMICIHSSPNVIRAIKSRRMRWAMYVARMGEKRGTWF